MTSVELKAKMEDIFPWYNAVEMVSDKYSLEGWKPSEDSIVTNGYDSDKALRRWMITDTLGDKYSVASELEDRDLEEQLVPSTASTNVTLQHSNNAAASYENGWKSNSKNKSGSYDSCRTTSSSYTSCTSYTSYIANDTSTEISSSEDLEDRTRNDPSNALVLYTAYRGISQESYSLSPCTSDSSSNLFAGLSTQDQLQLQMDMDTATFEDSSEDEDSIHGSLCNDGFCNSRITEFSWMFEDDTRRCQLLTDGSLIKDGEVRVVECSRNEGENHINGMNWLIPSITNKTSLMESVSINEDNDITQGKSIETSTQIDSAQSFIETVLHDTIMDQLDSGDECDIDRTKSVDVSSYSEILSTQTEIEARLIKRTDHDTFDKLHEISERKYDILPILSKTSVDTSTSLETSLELAKSEISKESNILPLSSNRRVDTDTSPETALESFSKDISKVLQSISKSPLGTDTSLETIKRTNTRTSNILQSPVGAEGSINKQTNLYSSSEDMTKFHHTLANTSPETSLEAISIASTHINEPLLYQQKELEQLSSAFKVTENHGFCRELQYSIMSMFDCSLVLTFAEKDKPPTAIYEFQSSVDPEQLEPGESSNTALFTAIRDNNCEGALTCLQKHPEETRMWVTYHDPILEDYSLTSSPEHFMFLPLHTACIFGSPLCVVKELVRLYPEALKAKAGNSKFPIHMACDAGVDSEVLTHLIDSWPQSIFARDGDGNIPLCALLRQKPLCARKTKLMMILLNSVEEQPEDQIESW